MTTVDRRAVQELIERSVPANWLDPILTGPNKVERLDQLCNALRERLLSGLANLPSSNAQAVAYSADNLFTNPFDLRRELEMHRDFSLGFALCNMDHAGTRRDVKKAQEHIEAVIRALCVCSGDAKEA